MMLINLPSLAIYSAAVKHDSNGTVGGKRTATRVTDGVHKREDPSLHLW